MEIIALFDLIFTGYLGILYYLRDSVKKEKTRKIIEEWLVAGCTVFFLLNAFVLISKVIDLLSNLLKG